jgi:hypothetical protein
VDRWEQRNAGESPPQGENLRIGEYLVTVAQRHAHGLRRVRVTRLSPEELEALEQAEEESGD